MEKQCLANLFQFLKLPLKAFAIYFTRAQFLVYNIYNQSLHNNLLNTSYIEDDLFPLYQPIHLLILENFICFQSFFYLGFPNFIRYLRCNINKSFISILLHFTNYNTACLLRFLIYYLMIFNLNTSFLIDFLLLIDASILCQE